MTTMGANTTHHDTPQCDVMSVIADTCQFAATYGGGACVATRATQPLESMSLARNNELAHVT